MTSINQLHHQYDQPFPLKQYFLLYAGIGGIIFYALLFIFIARTERMTLYDQYIQHVIEKAGTLYKDIDRDFLQVRGLQLSDIHPTDSELLKTLRLEIGSIVKHDFALAKVKVFNKNGIVLYDLIEPQNVGQIYAARNEAGFLTALAGKASAKVESDADGRRFMEVYLPILTPEGQQVAGIVELYEDVTRFEKQVFDAIKQALPLPTGIFILFSFVLFLVVNKADKLITLKTALLISVRQNMEKYVSQSTVDAIYSSITEHTELFQGERKTIVVFFSDIRGFTSFSEDKEPEVVVEELNRIFQIQADIIHAHKGVIDKFVGDQIMAVFPEDAASSAIDAAQEIIRTIAASPQISTKIGIGIHVGEAVVGSLGSRERRDYTAIGDTVNTASRLCSAAGPGEIVVSAAVYRQTSSEMAHQLTPHKALLLKGKKTSIEAFLSSPLQEPLAPEP